MSAVPVTVTGAGSLFGQGILKCLRRGGLETRVHGLDYFPDAVGFRWCDSTGLLPDVLAPGVSEDEWFGAICAAVSEAGSRFLFVGADFELLPLAERAGELMERTGCRAVVSPPETVAICKDKLRTARVLGDAGVKVPRSFAADEELERVEQAMPYPMIVKPRFGARSRGLRLVSDRAGLTRALAEADRPLIQEFLPDDDAEYTCGVMTFDGRVDSVAVLRRRLKDGNTVEAVGERNEAIEAACVRIAEILDPFGPINVQLRLVDGAPHVFEINPRFSGTTIFRALLGLNEPERLLRHLLGLPLAPAPQIREEKVVRYFEESVEPAEGAEHAAAAPAREALA